MSWSYSGVGKVEELCRSIDTNAAQQSGQCKIEMDAAVPHLKALLNQNFDKNNPELIMEITAYGSGWCKDGEQVERSCSVTIKRK